MVYIHQSAEGLLRKPWDQIHFPGKQTDRILTFQMGPQRLELPLCSKRLSFSRVSK